MVIKVFQDLKELIVAKPGVNDVCLNTNEPATEDGIRKWELSTGLKLPQDLKDFYLTTNGIEFVWCNVCNERTCTIGRIKINSLEEFKSVRLEFTNSSGEEEISGNEKLFLSSLLGSDFENWPCAYELEKCLNGTSVVYVFDRDNGVYVLNHDLSIHEICCTFEQYVRLAIVHLGLRDWQLWYTNDKPSPNSQQLCSLYTPGRLYLNTPDSREQFLFDLQSWVPASFSADKVINLETSRLDHSKLSGKTIQPGIQNKRGRSSDSCNRRSSEVWNTGRRSKK
uniref:Knr4/Smi1-like domain-containing protein n=1 Tax=Trichobilharzia regenti TaxID=157069 RepID=A0AA85JWX6_TRIRE|nr:unnamed protein product [Trichobilharzia regenti]